MSSLDTTRTVAPAKCPEHGDAKDVVGYGKGADPCSVDGCDHILWSIEHVCSACTRTYTIWEFEARCEESETIITSPDGARVHTKVTFTCECGETHETIEP